MENLGKLFGRPIGIFSDVFVGTERERAERIASFGFTCVQWRLPLATQDINESNVRSLLKQYQDRGLAIAALAGYENIVDPNPALKRQNLDRLKRLMDIAPLCGGKNSWGTLGVATETGSKNRVTPWEWHADNAAATTWAELKATITDLARYAKQAGAKLLLEGYVKNVLRTTDDIQRLLRELRTVEYGFVLDPCNLLTADNMPQPAMMHAMAHMVAVMGKRAVIAHAKDVSYFHGAIATPRAGTGQLDYKTYLAQLDAHLPGVPLILEHLRADEVQSTLDFLIRVRSS
jgi:sugar phosphate isomerase/epimerase